MVADGFVAVFADDGIEDVSHGAVEEPTERIHRVHAL